MDDGSIHGRSIDDVFAGLKASGCEIEPCGSRITCCPPPTDTDADYLIVVPGDALTVSGVVSGLSMDGFAWEGGEHYQVAAATDFMSWRRDEVNLIVTASQEFAKRHRAATAVAKRLNLMAKDDRVALFQAVLYGNDRFPTPSPEPVKTEGGVK